MASIPRVLKDHYFWPLVLMFAIGVTMHYPQQILATDSPSLFSFLGLTRHAVERVFLLLPIAYASFLFMTKGGLFSLVLALAIMLPRVFLISQYPTDAIFETALVIIIGSLITLFFSIRRRDMAKLKKAEGNLQYYLKEIIKAQEGERKRISRELHDSTTQNLIALLHQLENYLNERPELSKEDARILWSFYNKIKDVSQELRRFSRDLRPPMLDDLGLLPALEWVIAEFENEYRLKVDLEAVGTQQKISRESELLLFRIIQEALRNITKHAQASNAKIKVEFNKEKITVTISDDGIGFKIPDNLIDLPQKGKLGLAGIEERVKLLGGKLRIESELGSGTTVFVETPV